MVVDDHPLNVELIEACLVDVDCRVISATSGPAALELMSSDPPDLVLLDVMMPGMDGYEVCERIKRSPEGVLVPVVMVTALGQIADRVRGLDAGADDFIVKPIERIELVARVRSLFRVKQLHLELEGAQRTVFALARAVAARQPDGEGRGERVGMLARDLGKAAGLRGSALDGLLWGGALRDIGNIAVPDSILLKAGTLGESETAVMRSHVSVGVEIARPLGAAPELLPIIRHHHERWDGNGYPDGLAGESIPLPARIVAICDAYDALLGERPHRPARTAAEAVAILRAGAGSQWDPSLVERFIHLIGEPAAEPAVEQRAAAR
ncbi:MAG: response regulator [Candidatus Dormibacteraceae bacterium]